MFRIVGNSGSDCTGLTRRSFLQAGVFGGLSLATLSQLHAAQGPRATKPKDAAVVLFWLSGGPGHMETWDPKPNAPEAYRGPLGAIRTSIPGIQFADLMPEEAK